MTYKEIIEIFRVTCEETTCVSVPETPGLWCGNGTNARNTFDIIVETIRSNSKIVPSSRKLITIDEEKSVFPFMLCTVTLITDHMIEEWDFMIEKVDIITEK